MPTSSCLTYSTISSELNAELFGSSGDCIKLMDLDGCLTLLNPGGIAALELSRHDQLLGETWWTIWPRESEDVVKNSFERAKNGSINSFHAFCPTSTGSPRWWDVVASPLFDSNGKLNGVMAVSRDVSELVNSRLELQKANQRKDDFLAILSHEFRNPIAAATSATGVLKLISQDKGRIGQIANLIQRQLAHMSRITEDLIDASRIGRGELSLMIGEVDLKLVLTETVEQLQAAFTAKNQVVTTEVCVESCLVAGDGMRLLQVAGNLLGNAVRYTPSGGTILIEIIRQGSNIELSFTDSGIGIPDERILGIFDIYAQVEKSVARNTGLGLGLALVHSLVNLHGGTVHAESKGINLGSKFTVNLPALK